MNWTNRGDLLRYADKKKIEDWITQQRSNSAEVEIQYFDVTTKIAKSFENQNISGKNMRDAERVYTDDEVSMHNDPWSKVTGKSIPTQEQSQCFR